MAPSPELIAYYASGKPLVCELDANPFLCEFWPPEELEQYNQEYEVSEYAPGYFGFATSGGGEMFALAPNGAIVCLPFVGMGPAAASPVASSWSAFEGMLRNAL
ncbi:SMI1/KNR4 family protein [Niveibacterium microcysteis]|uniref:SMI1/KNR4 family protein n=1 Tax=Niveibacterium microcysteis TaxID=2811415 RepID=A0ABX7M869_9RHOO|nr:SMI1/KNR4 family protein [Niveibacterium microcysteis]QSI76645.1 SMI1/KNR4 family protein [Niveibacterium microcysteis]